MPKFIGIKQLWYGPVINANTNLNQSGIETLKASMTEVKNVHQDTWGYQEGDPSTTEYKNELTGLTYFTDKTELGQKTIQFTMGEYDYATKADLYGGAAVNAAGHNVADLPEGDTDTNAVGWVSSGALELIHKSVLALTKTNTYILFTNANIVAKGDQQQKAIGLGITAIAEENPAENVDDEYWFDQVSA